MDDEKLKSLEAGLQTCRNVGEMEDYLLENWRPQTIEYETGLSETLAEEEPDRFFNIGSRVLDRGEFSEQEYREKAITNAKYLYERFPILFEFYDECMNKKEEKKEAKEESSNMEIKKVVISEMKEIYVEYTNGLVERYEVDPKLDAKEVQKFMAKFLVEHSLRPEDKGELWNVYTENSKSVKEVKSEYDKAMTVDVLKTEEARNQLAIASTTALMGSDFVANAIEDSLKGKKV